MIMPTQMSLGVDITADRINLALLKQTRDGIALVKAVNAPMPAGAISQGNVKDPAILARAIAALRKYHKIRTRRTVVSLFARPTLAQVMDLPKILPSNIRQYIQKEVKHCAVLPSRNIVLDYWGIPSSSARSAGNRVYVVATENEKVAGLTKALNQAGLSVKAVEPAEVACARALYEKKIAKNLDSNVLIALVQDADVTLSVFRKQTLDFIRNRNIGQDICQSREGLERFAEEIGAIIQYYDVEIGDSSQNWQLIIVLRQAIQDTEETADLLREKFNNLQIEVLSAESACEYTPVAVNSDAQKPSLVAVGLAMRLLKVNQPRLKINLVPPEAAEIKALKQQALITANVTAAVLVVIILVAGVLGVRTKKVNEAIAHLREKQAAGGATVLLTGQERTYRRADSLSKKLEQLNEILRSKRTADWNLILDDVRYRTPKSLWITSLTGEVDSRILIEGRSTSYEAVHHFVDMLGKSEYIDSAALVEVEKDESTGGLVSYSIDCSLIPFEGA